MKAARIERMQSTWLLLSVTVLFAALMSGQQTHSPLPSKAGSGTDLCRMESLPSGVRTRIKREFGSWRVQEPENLSSSARERWKSERPSACPGIAVGEFENSAMSVYAVLLVPIGRPASAYRLLVFSGGSEESQYKMTTLRQSSAGGADLSRDSTCRSRECAGLASAGDSSR